MARVQPKDFDCPVCGETVPGGSKSCPECGACEKSGWNSDAEVYDGVDLPDDEFDYEKLTNEEFGTPRKRSGAQTVWWIAGLVLLAAFVIGYLNSCSVAP